ncbi:MAG: EamA family transporter [Acidobacteriota bacterium]
MKGIHLFIISMIIWVLSQVLIKNGMNKFAGIGINLNFFIRALTSPFVLAGIFLSGIGVLVWLIILSRYELSYSNLIVSFTYVLMVLASIIFFREHISTLRWIGTFFIMVGVYLVFKT